MFQPYFKLLNGNVTTVSQQFTKLIQFLQAASVTATNTAVASTVIVRATLDMARLWTERTINTKRKCATSPFSTALH